MFESAEVGRKVEKEEYAAQVPDLRMQLLRAQNDLRSRNFPVLILINGVEGAGKGETVNILHEWMDPRYLETHAFGPLSDEERERPDFWRFWRTLPGRGRIGIYFGSWYTQPILRRVFKESKADELGATLERINDFEQMLHDDGALLIKFWFHLGKKAQKKRLKSLEQDSEHRWRVTPHDWKLFKHYDRFYEVCTRALRETSTGHSPWLIVEGADPRYRYLTVGRQILEAMTKRLARPPRQKPSPPPPLQKKPGQRTVISALDLSQKVDEKRYKHEIEEWQGRLNQMHREATKRRVSSLLVFEGADAAGKGGAVRRVTAALDARFYRVIPIAAPTDEERAHHYLWRFWRHLPRAGRVTIFDRSWYGRVLVERVEGFAHEAEWMRAYKEINEFEEQLVAHGVVLVKFWLQVSPAEQLRRFKEREKTGYKKYKITAEDYRNRAQWDAYELAVHDMVERTSTEFAPWHLIAADDKYHARLKIFEVFCGALKKALGKT